VIVSETHPHPYPLHSYHFTGKVLPERTYVTLVIERPVSVSIPSMPWVTTVAVSIVCAQISLIFASRAEVTDIWTLKNVAQSIAQDLVDALGYTGGRGYGVEITAVSDATGRHLVFGVGVPVLEDNQKDRPLPSEAVVLLAISHPWLSRALGDLRGAITEPADTGFHCMRAVESVRQHFQGDLKPGEAWPAMRSALNFREETLKTLNDFGTPQRHGQTPPMTDADRARDMTLAWKVVDRFVVLLHRSCDQLPTEEFPFL
jgi:hypothetical protein